MKMMSGISGLLLLVNLASACGAEPDGANTDARGESLAVEAEPLSVAQVSDQSPARPELKVGRKSAGDLLVMSLNVRIPNDSGDNAWANRRPRLRDMIRSYGPDIIGLQEFRQQTFNELTADLPEYWWYYVDRGDGERIAIFVNTNRLQPLNWDYRNITNSQRDAHCGAGDDEDSVNRPIQYVQFWDSVTDQVTYFYNTHYPSKNSCERIGQSEIVSEYIAGRDDFNSHVIMVGDLNDGVNADGSWNSSYKRLLDLTGLFNAYADVHPMDSSQAFGTIDAYLKTPRFTKAIDHVLVSSGIVGVEAEVDRSMFTGSPGTRISCPVVTNGKCSNGSVTTSLKSYSDHWGVWAKVHYF